MKRIFAILAAVLLTSVCTMAQSNDATPLKGDVNGDGMVDVADIVAVIDVMEKGGGGGEEPEPTYTWYQGMGTEEEIQTQSYIDGLSYNQVTKPANDSALTLSRGYNVLIFPSSWGTPTFGGTADYSKQFEPYTADELNIENPSDKTVFVIEAASDGIAYIKFNYNVEEPEPTYYWYVGTTVPTDPTNSAQSTGLNKWTSLGTSLPTTDIKVVKEDPEYNDHTWYIAAPTAANFTLYNATNVASNEAGWNKTTFNVGSVSYTLWTSKGQSDQAVGYLHK